MVSKNQMYQRTLSDIEKLEKKKTIQKLDLHKTCYQLKINQKFLKTLDDIK